MMNSEHGVASDSCELTPECSSLSQEELQVLQLEQGGKFKEVWFFFFFLIGYVSNIMNLAFFLGGQPFWLV